jgi:hypothetical protein
MAGASRLLGKEEEKKEKQLDALSSLSVYKALWPRLNTLLADQSRPSSRDFFMTINIFTFKIGVFLLTKMLEYARTDLWSFSIHFWHSF